MSFGTSKSKRLERARQEPPPGTATNAASTQQALADRSQPNFISFPTKRVVMRDDCNTEQETFRELSATCRNPKLKVMLEATETKKHLERYKGMR